MPHVQIPEKLEPILHTNKRLVVLLGGRSSAKSVTVAGELLKLCKTQGADILCGREYQNSIDDSVHKLLKELIEKYELDGFNVTDKKIDCLTGGCFRFRGFARNSEAVKSAQNFKYSWIEEAQSLSQQSIDDLLPTIRAEGSRLFFTANPQSSADPFSKRFIVPFQKELDLNGIYEDDMHLIIKINWRDNPWHKELEEQRVWDFNNLPRAKYDWIWEGAFNDSTENPLIYAEWFDACIDAHKRPGMKFEPRGFKMAAHDPSDLGPDHKGFAYRHGSVLLDVQQKIEGNINEGCDWALDLALNHQVDSFTWDCDGMGVGLNRQVQKAFGGKHTIIFQFKGSEGVDLPDAVYMPADRDGAPITLQKTNKQALKNKRAQYYYELRNKIYRTYEAVEKGVYHDPDTMISFDSSIKLLPELRAELCRMPIKPNGAGLIELYTKEALKKKPFEYESPNLADSVMMLMKVPSQPNRAPVRMPKPIRQFGRR